MTSRVLVIIPCFNEAENISGLYDELRQVEVVGCSISAVFVNDASSDNSLEVLRSVGATYLDNSVNLGIGGTMQVGFRYALENGFNYAVQMDGDGQHPPSELPALLFPLLSDKCDAVVGSRFLGNESFRSTAARRMGIRVFHWLNKLLGGVSIRDSTSGFRAYNRKVIQHFTNYYPDEYPEPETVLYLAHKKMRLMEVPVTMRPRQGGVSSIGNLSSLYYMGKVVLNILFLHLRSKNA